jgi:hypothetical protein
LPHPLIRKRAFIRGLVGARARGISLFRKLLSALPQFSDRISPEVLEIRSQCIERGVSQHGPASCRSLGRFTQSLGSAVKFSDLGAQRLQLQILSSYPGVQLSRFCALGVQSSKVRHASGGKVWLYLSAPTIFQILGFLLRLPTSAADMDHRDVANADFDLGSGFDINRLEV